jgi:ferric-dicitrate binding protein FerR (iron transport regulator)
MIRRHQIDIDWNVLDRYFSGETSPDESAQVLRWSNTPEGAELLRSAREIWDAAGVTVAASTPDLQSRFDAVWERALLLDAPPPTTIAIRTPSRSAGIFATSRRPSRSARIWPALIAASVVGAIGVFGLNKMVANRSVAVQPRVAEATGRQFTTRRAQRADLYLSDGTHVVLNVDSRLLVSPSYGERSREVTLVGEGYFDVVHDVTRPFRVHTAAGVAEDVGTSFVVTQYPESRGMQVGVASGSVDVRKDSSATATTRLVSGDLARVGSVGINVRHGVDIENATAWTTGKLVFDRVPLKEALARLSRWYDSDIRLGDTSLSDVPYTAEFSSEPLPQVLELLTASLDARVERNARSGYVIYSLPAKPKETH